MSDTMKGIYVFKLIDENGRRKTDKLYATSVENAWERFNKFYPNVRSATIQTPPTLREKEMIERRRAKTNNQQTGADMVKAILGGFR